MVKSTTLPPDTPLSTKGIVLKEVEVEIAPGFYNSTGKLFHLPNP